MKNTVLENSPKNAKKTGSSNSYKNVITDVEKSPFKIYKKKDGKYNVILGNYCIHENVEELEEAKEKAKEITWENIEKYVLGVLEIINTKEQ